MNEIEEQSEKEEAQFLLRGRLQERLGFRGMCGLGFRGGSVTRELYASSHGGLWAAIASKPDSKSVPKYWNAFGVYDESKNIQNIIVEVNVPASKTNATVAGFFARDYDNNIKLMHDGSIGGGRKGVGRAEFLEHSKPNLVDVNRISRKSRSGIIVCDVSGRNIVEEIWNFVRMVEKFKKSE